MSRSKQFYLLTSTERFLFSSKFEPAVFIGPEGPSPLRLLNFEIEFSANILNSGKSVGYGAVPTLPLLLLAPRQLPHVPK